MLHRQFTLVNRFVTDAVLQLLILVKEGIETFKCVPQNIFFKMFSSIVRIHNKYYIFIYCISHAVILML
jgi:hypothetical protein